MTDQIQFQAPPVLSTPETHIFEDPIPATSANNALKLTDDDIWSVYEIRRTAREIRDGGWKRIALQFPDHMLGDSVRVFEGLESELKRLSAELPLPSIPAQNPSETEELERSFNNLSTSSTLAQHTRGKVEEVETAERVQRHRLYILADTSYGACCVDEIAAEHVEAEVVVHYGRSCLSPTARLPVIYVFTSMSLNIEDVVAAFEETYLQQTDGDRKEKGDKVILIADITFHYHVPAVHKALESRGWLNILAPEVVHNPSSLIPNRKVEMNEEALKTYSIFHISDPPPALLLTLSSRVKNLYINSTTTFSSPNPISVSTKPQTKTIQSNTSMALRRRYALLTSLSTNPIFGILINTLSVKNYLPTIATIKSQIAAAGKKSYTFVVGKVNAAKIANFSEIGGWVVVGCWESSLIESTEFYRPIITPFELGLALMGDRERVWSGAWRGDFSLLPPVDVMKETTVIRDGSRKEETDDRDEENRNAVDGGDLDSEEESEPPEFDLRTGRYVSHSRPMRTTSTLPIHPNPSSSNYDPSSSLASNEASKVLTRRAKLDLATVNGTVSPGAEYLRSQRTWTGLGSDFNEEEASQSIEEGRSGVARGYTVGEGGGRT